jgi:tryptophan-rich sensory protein
MDLSLLGFVAIVVVAASSGAFFPPGRWYEGLQKPSWRPPNWAFPVVWSILYALIALSGWIVWHAASPEQLPLAMTLFAVQLVFNAAWSWLFFGLKRMRLAFLDLALLWLSIAAMIIVYWRIDVAAALLLLPYIAWVTTAGALNRAMIRLNPEVADGPVAGRA